MGLKTWIGGVGRGLRAFARRAASDVGGNVAMLFGLSMPVLIMLTFGGVDVHRLSSVRVNLQDALDAATLAAARSPYTSDADLTRIGLATLQANLQNREGLDLLEEQTTFTLVDNVVIADAKVNVDTLVANIVLPPYGQLMDDSLPVSAHSEVDRSSRNVEVSLALDITGSMAGQKLTDLKAAAKQLVDLVVQDIQTPYYSKVALVPWSNAVNPGSGYLTSVRGSVRGSSNVTGATMNLIGTPRTITGATKARPAVVTSANHGFLNGQVVWITGASGMTQLNNKPYVVTNKTTNTFELYRLDGARVDSRNYGTYSGSGGRVQQCQDNDCSITFTSSSHGLANNDYVYFTNVGGLRDTNGDSVVNGRSFLVGNVTSNTFTVEPPDGQSITPYTSGGQAWCAQQGCTYFAFEDIYGDLRTHQISPCVTERTGGERYTDAGTGSSSAKVGRLYPSIYGVCLDDPIMPLTTDRAAVKDRIDDFTATGGTAGQIGIAWSWYMISPNFNALWPSNGAGAYEPTRTLKAAVIMTDGEFNTNYCSGVLARDAGSGSGSLRIDCDADNGDSFTQSRALCDGMKAQGIVVYTVGFQITAGGEAAQLLEDCASTPDNFFMPSTGGDLSEAFAAIGRDITKLRITK